MNTKTGILILIILFILIGACVYYLFPLLDKPAPAPAGNPPVVQAPQGQVTSGFPKELLLEPNAAITQSYVAGGQSTAEWTSTASIDYLYNEYLTYFTANTWSVTNKITSPASVRGIYATKNSAQVSVTIVGQSNGTAQVIVSYIPAPTATSTAQ